MTFSPALVCEVDLSDPVAGITARPEVAQVPGDIVEAHRRPELVQNEGTRRTVAVFSSLLRHAACPPRNDQRDTPGTLPVVTDSGLPRLLTTPMSGSV